MIELRIYIDLHRNSIIIISLRQVSESAQEIGVSPENTHRTTQAPFKTYGFNLRSNCA